MNFFIVKELSKEFCLFSDKSVFFLLGFLLVTKNFNCSLLWLFIVDNLEEIIGKLM
jgi:hypothetical protein